MYMHDHNYVQVCMTEILYIHTHMHEYVHMQCIRMWLIVITHVHMRVY